ncbi:DgyrCDS1861 [Dimorphilus gyrociliatus]|nr:DgyrCDS1861 [Dimorphilus gyrociliatus]
MVVTDKGTPKNQPAVYVAGRMLEIEAFKFYNRLWRYQFDVTEERISKLGSNVGNENLFQPSSHTTVIKMVEVKDQDYLLYFFNELALEYTPPKSEPSQLVARVARVCKKDSSLGGWSSLVKVQLVCQSDEKFSPDQTVIYNKLIALTISEDGERFYGIFKNNGKKSSQTGVCSYSLSEINNALNVDTFYEKRTENSLSFLIPSSVPKDIPYKPGICRPSSKSIVDEERVRKYLSKTTIKHDTLIKTPFTLSKPGIIWNHIAVDETSNRDEKIFYLTTNTRGISKIALKVNGSVDDISEIYPFDSSLEEDFYNTFELHGNSIYFTTDAHVGKLSLKELCASYSTCTSCLSDPDCSWDSIKNTCKYPGGSLSAPVHVQCSNGMMQKDLSKARSIQAIKLSSNACIKENKDILSRKKYVRGTNTDILMSCESYCNVVDDKVRWFKNGEELTFNDKKYTINKEFSLIVWNVTSAEKGLFTCVTGNLNIVLSIWEVITADCNPNDAECIWRDEFNKWCQKFDEYTLAFNIWKCMENSCQNSDADTCYSKEARVVCEEKHRKYTDVSNNR